MADYSPTQIVDMILILGECHNNFAAASRLYAVRFPDRRHPSDMTIKTLTERAREGHLVRQRRHHDYEDNDVRTLTILAAVHLDPHISTRQIERETGIPQSTVSRILRYLNYHAYHITLTQALQPRHILARINFCQWALQTIQSDPYFFRYLLFSDEAKFYSDGQLNRHNCHYWSHENPYWFRAVDHQNRWSLMIWCGIVNGYLIGPYFFDQNVDRHSYLALIRDHLPGLLENVDLAMRQRMWLQQDGAAPYFARIVQDFLNNRYDGRWIGRGGPIQWPASSPNLTSPDFFLWGYVKNVVFAQRPTSREDMMERIRTACAAIPRETLLRTVDSFERRVRMCLQANGENFEQFIRG
ncbi:uncharacterized protein LOC131672314 [Phymastichus coffea]|uniref:uncharacterized protein LOC131672314 n=1 Tax=Phymastichus coffea TaxID=108790 RepID=UPI00273C4E1B|nr:uncharacterized protein LOC131672314 [Phymastichus coffea]